MGIKRSKKERRIDPRVEQALPLKLAACGYDFVTTTKNVSSSGAYCRVNKYIPPFTKIAVKMTLPIFSKAKKEEYIVNCNGVIVRTEDKETGFNIAIFFNELKDSQRNKISRYIGQFLPK